MNFTIKSIYANRAGYIGELDAVVEIKMDAKEWASCKKKRQLGHLYGVAISNQVYVLVNKKINAYNPTVRDTERASKGVKTIHLRYPMTKDQGEALGLNPHDYFQAIYVEGRGVLRLVV